MATFYVISNFDLNGWYDQEAQQFVAPNAEASSIMSADIVDGQIGFAIGAAGETGCFLWKVITN